MSEIDLRQWDYGHDFSGQPVGEALCDVQALVAARAGKILTLVRPGPKTASHLSGGTATLYRGKGDACGQPDWPEGAHVAMATPIHPIAVVVDARLTNEAILVGHGASVRIRVHTGF